MRSDVVSIHTVEHPSNAIGIARLVAGRRAG